VYSLAKKFFWIFSYKDAREMKLSTEAADFLRDILQSYRLSSRTTQLPTFVTYGVTPFIAHLSGSPILVIEASFASSILRGNSSVYFVLVLRT